MAPERRSRKSQERGRPATWADRDEAREGSIGEIVVTPRPSLPRARERHLRLLDPDTREIHRLDSTGSTPGAIFAGDAGARAAPLDAIELARSLSWTAPPDPTVDA